MANPIRHRGRAECNETEPNGGGRGIRTLETLEGPTRFRVVRLQPLGHPTKKQHTKTAMMFGEHSLYHALRFPLRQGYEG